MEESGICPLCPPQPPQPLSMQADASRKSPGDHENTPRFKTPWEYEPWELEPWGERWSGWSSVATTVRERAMLSLMEQLTNKNDWRRKVFDEEICSKWGKEAKTKVIVTGGEEEVEFSQKMWDWCLAELRDKATRHVETGMVTVFDNEAAVVKSDTIIPEELRTALQTAVAPLEDIPDRLKDWHPGSDGKVLDLVHPSLFPLVNGRSRVLKTGKVCPVHCMESCGKGKVVEMAEVTPGLKNAHRSGEFQWLPCDVAFDGAADVKITSYINNLHPQHFEELYRIIEKIIAKTVPLWDETLSALNRKQTCRIPVDDYKYVEREDYWEQSTEEVIRVLTEAEEWQLDDYRDDFDSVDEKVVKEARQHLKNCWQRAVRTLVYPEPKEYSPLPDSQSVNLRQLFSDDGIQVIVKLANIHLTPNQPQYTGGSWHIEGMKNEEIIASAIYYYDSTNITDSHLAFRYSLEGEDMAEKAYDQHDYSGVENIFGVVQDKSTVVEVGQILTRQSRLIAFPNVLQHRVSPFSLTDKTKPGHRKILALFLVDPTRKITSTATVPPQQREWWAAHLMQDASHVKGLGSLPPELMDQIVQGVEDFPISLQDAKEIREKLMLERSRFVEEANSAIEDDTFSFCEH